MRCSRCLELLDVHGFVPAWDAFTGQLICDPCHESEVDYRDDDNFPEAE